MSLIRKYLQAGVLVNGVFEKTEKGTPNKAINRKRAKRNKGFRIKIKRDKPNYHKGAYPQQ